MRGELRNALLFALAAIVCATGPALYRATARSTPVPSRQLDALANVRVGDWQPTNEDVGFVNASPLGAEGEQIQAYDHVVYRSFVRPDGTTLMLVLAYLGQQQLRAGVHRPESCYTSQGFALSEQGRRSVTAGGRTIEVHSFLAARDERQERVSYWMRVGSKVSRSPVAFRMETLRAAWAHQIPDGLLVRASIVQGSGEATLSDAQVKTALNDFLTGFIAGSSPEGRKVLIG